MSSTAKSLVEFIDNYVLVDQSSWAIQELVNSLSDDTEQAAAHFCDRFELGNWFYEALTLDNVDISAELINIGARKEREEQESTQDHAVFVRDLRQMTGPC